MNLKKDLQDANVKSAIISSLLFFILAFPELFQAVDSLLRKVVGGKFMNMHLVVLVIHSVLFGVMFYYINQFLQKRVLVEGQQIANIRNPTQVGGGVPMTDRERRAMLGILPIDGAGGGAAGSAADPCRTCHRTNNPKACEMCSKRLHLLAFQQANHGNTILSKEPEDLPPTEPVNIPPVYGEYNTTSR